MCEKTQFADKDKARHAAKIIKFTSNDVMSVYKCQRCSFYHLGHTNQSHGDNPGKLHRKKLFEIRAAEAEGGRYVLHRY
jgi:hypothetical protein